ncbi:DUF5685 family protein [Nonomuraea roseoviolacea]|uniref:Regulatory protein n=1 Tax=Nonomuraea roseoviolacea subsp. carminata TaxID=160689 RepID=A0ABT1KAF7_9ACTN|nr:DUF5685 family protein [Nonomuraea roseoviolacea]MCP2351003.1 hypothetical protein [Nonomuraea roseoviolacea subsp. carminata]
MFGIIRPCVTHACASVRDAWRAHLCGLCLTLRDGQGQAARLATNYDTLIVSVLAEAQLPSASPHRTAGPCALRGFRRADVVDHRARGARLAASVSLVLAAGRLRDHAADGDSAPAAGVAGRVLATRWEAAGARLGAEVGFDTATLATAADRQVALERRAATALLDRGGREAAPGGGVGARGGAVGLLELTRPTEEAVAAAFAHTAVLAGRPGNTAALAEIGTLFGRLAHLLDAAEDQEEDAARGAFNPLTATGTGRDEARRLCDDAAHGIALAVRDLELEQRHLVEVLLGTEVRRAVARSFGGGHEKASRRRPAWPLRTVAAAGTVVTCGLWRPEWSELKNAAWDDRCYLRDGCDGCEGCCDCCQCSCDCCDCCEGCDCSCGN